MTRRKMRQILIGPLLDDRLKWETPKARKGQPLSLCILKSYGFRYRPDIQPIFKYVDTSVLDRSNHRQKLERLSLDRYSVSILVFVCLSVCLFVCPQSTGHSFLFWPRNLIFWHNTPWDIFRNFDFWPFEGPFSAIFEYFLLYPL